MALSSMTGFARGHGVAGAYAWSWEIKSVNAKGLDLRFRLPAGWDAVEVPARARGAEKLSRGTVYANLTVERKGVQPTVKVNEPVLDAVLSTLKGLSGKVEAAPPSLDGILSAERRDRGHRGRRDARRTIAPPKAQSLPASRRRWPRLSACGVQKVLRLAVCCRPGSMKSRRSPRARRAAPGRKPEAIKARLAEQVATLLSASERFDSDRLHQEAVMLAAKADIREELDRLASHVAQAKKLLADGGAIGRKLDFLAQELHRESNTLTAKANDVDLTNIGLELKSVVEQFREQVQNLE